MPHFRCQTQSPLRRYTVAVSVAFSFVLLRESSAQQAVPSVVPLQSGSPVAPRFGGAEDFSAFDNADLRLTGPANSPAGNSTLEIRVARRPWLLDKLRGKDTQPSTKMTPPRPPVELPDPPSMSKIQRQRDRRTMLPPTNESAQLDSSRAGAPDAANANSVNRLRNRDDVQPNEGKTTATETVDLQPDSDASLVELVSPIAIRSKLSGDVPETGTDPTPEPGPERDNETGSTATLSIDAQQPGGSMSARAKTAVGEKTTDEEAAKERLLPRGDGPLDGRKSANENEVDDDLVEITAEVEPPSARQAPIKDTLSNYVGDDSDPSSRPAVDYAGYPQQTIRLTRNVYRMRNGIEQTLRYYYNKAEIATERSNWGMMHAIMVYGSDTQVIVGRQRFSTVAWIAGNNACRGQKLLAMTDGRITAKSGVGLQGHQGQLLAVLALAGVPTDYELYAGETKFTVSDLIESEKLACKRGEELTFTLIGLAHYLHTEDRWQNADGESWDFEKLIREELAQPIVGAACGGTHRLMGYGHALRARRTAGLPITGQWKRAELYTQDFMRYVYKIQNRDGSMSTDWFEGREDNGDMDRKVQTTGHMVEWLLTVTPDSQLQNPRLVSAIRYLLKSMLENRDNDWKIGPKGHALRSLAMYHERVFKQQPPWKSSRIATTGPAGHR